MRDFLVGVGLFGQGLKRYVRSPRTIALGLIPAMVSLALFLALFAVLFYFIGDIVTWATWFADDWSDLWRTSVRIGAGIALVGVTALLAIVSYTAVTLLIGDPFYEAIAESIEDELGGVPDEVEQTFWRSMRRSIVDALRLLLISAIIGIPLFVLGFIPIIGQTIIPAVGALVGGWFLALELVGMAFNRRGLRLRHRRELLRQHRMVSLGFGAAVFGCFLIPFGAVLLMPAAVIGGTLLARHAFGLPTDA